MVIIGKIANKKRKKVSSGLLWTGNQEEDIVLSRPGDLKQHNRNECVYM